MHPVRLLFVLALALFVGAASTATSVAIPRPDGCRRVVTTGPAFIGRHCKAGQRVVRVDHRPVIVNPHRAARFPRFERPVDRLRTRGDGRIKAHGDKAARRELRQQINRR
jgi:hypothetical protein